MREIKFRGKNIVSGEWSYGDFTPEKMWPTKLVDCVGEYPSEPAQSVRPETVGQYTGLKDKNGREIYEGDILRLVYPEYTVTVKVEWREKSCCFSVTRVDREEKSFILDIWESQHGEVIGNIHDNPELLKKEE